MPEPVYHKAELEMGVSRASGVCALQAQTPWVLWRAKKSPLCHHQQLACDLPWGTQKIANSPQQIFHSASSPLRDTRLFLLSEVFKRPAPKTTAPVAVLRSIHGRTEEVETQLPAAATVTTQAVRVTHFLLYALGCFHT